jgi:large subunit ribosomal protein L17
MRHNKKFNHLSRTAAHRKSMLANMSISLIQHKRIQTTLAKAKALRVYIEPILTKSKEDTTASRRYVFSHLQNKEAVTELFQNVSQKIADRPGGYTRILKTGLRLGDSAEMCIIELVDYNENMLKDKVAKKTVRTRRSAAKKATDAPAAPAKEETVKAAAAKVKAAAPAAEKPVVVEPEKADAPVVEAANVVVDEPATKKETIPAEADVEDETLKNKSEKDTSETKESK